MHTTLAERRYDLDWLRIGAFALLILYHVGMVFVPWDFHIKTAHPSSAVEAPMLLLNAWRLPLLFLVSGAASRYLIAKSARGFAGSRSKRLLPPLLFGIAVIVPPQAWVDVTVNHGYAQGFLHFWASDYWRFDKSLGVIVPTWNHLWFILYLWVYTMLLAAGAALLPMGVSLQPGFDRLFAGWRLAILPVLWFAVYRVLLADRLPETHALVDDWGMHLVYGFAFGFGFGLAGTRTLWAQVAKLWRPAAVAGLASWAVLAWLNDLPGEIEDLGWAALPAFRFLRAVQCWAMILALLGLAQRYWNRDHPWRRTLNEAVFPAYIIHQTVIIVAEYWLRPAGLPAGAELAVLVTATVAGSALFYFGVRRVGWLRPFAGLRGISRGRVSAQPVAAG